MALNMPARLIPPIGLPTSSSFAEEEEWSSLLTSQLANVRKTAENWRNGFVSIIGLVTVFSVIKGPTSINNLDKWASYTVGLLILLTLTSASFGAWSSLIAAYGIPKIINRSGFRRLGGIHGYRFDLAKKSVSRLKQAQLAMILALILLMGALGLTWYGPRSTAVIIEIERQTLPKVCGELLLSNDGYIDIKLSSSQPLRVQMTDIVRLSVLEKCL